MALILFWIFSTPDFLLFVQNPTGCIVPEVYHGFITKFITVYRSPTRGLFPKRIVRYAGLTEPPRSKYYNEARWRGFAPRRPSLLNRAMRQCKVQGGSCPRRNANFQATGKGRCSHTYSATTRRRQTPVQTPVQTPLHGPRPPQPMYSQCAFVSRDRGDKSAPLMDDTGMNATRRCRPPSHLADSS